MDCTLSNLIPPTRKEELAAAVRLRTSCRSYTGEPLCPTELASLAYHAGRFALPGARLSLVRTDDACFTGAAAITGCKQAVALIVQRGTWSHRLHAGMIGEAFVLEATAMSLGTCWVTGSFRRGLITPAMQQDEELLGIIAVGKPTQPLTAPAFRNRKPPEQLCRGSWREWPEQLLRAATLVQQSPSAMNTQPWTLAMDERGAFMLHASVHAALDAGIALCHAELALTTPHTWHVSDDPAFPIATALPCT